MKNKLIDLLACFCVCLVFWGVFAIASTKYATKSETPKTTVKTENKGIVVLVSDSGTTKKPETIETTATTESKKELFVFTAYCSCAECCGEWSYNRPTDESGNEIVIGASGQKLVSGYSVAVDPTVIPYGTKLYANGKEYIAHDCGGAIVGNRVDVYFGDDHQQALEFGRQEMFVEVAYK